MALILRRAVRAVVLDLADRILLLHFRNPETGMAVWATPGGGLDEGEEPEAALRRELLEETGLMTFDCGPLVWRRRHTLAWGGETIDQRELYFLVRVSAFEPTPAIGTAGLAAENVDAHRWWTASEIAASSELFAPRELAKILRKLIENGPPEGPLDLGE